MAFSTNVLCTRIIDKMYKWTVSNTKTYKIQMKYRKDNEKSSKQKPIL